jgi:hypothetical protein
LRELTLTLLVARVLANDANDILALDDFAIFAEALYGGSDFHRYGLFLKLVSVVFGFSVPACTRSRIQPGSETNGTFKSVFFLIAAGSVVFSGLASHRLYRSASANRQ